MFKKNQKIEVYTYRKGENHHESSTSIPLNDGQLHDYLKSQYNRHGKLVIEFVHDERIILTTTDTLTQEALENKADEIKELVFNYVKERAINMDAYAVLHKGKLKGVFGKEVNSRLKQTRLERKGCNKEDIEIRKIKIESFEDVIE